MAADISASVPKRCSGTPVAKSRILACISGA
jgi:hypothetical protein